MRRLLGWSPLRLVGAVSYGAVPVPLAGVPLVVGGPYGPVALAALRAARRGHRRAGRLLVRRHRTTYPIRPAACAAHAPAPLPVIGVVNAGCLVLASNYRPPLAPPIAPASVSSAHAAGFARAQARAGHHLVPAIRVLVVGGLDCVCARQGARALRADDGRNRGGGRRHRRCGVAREGDLIGPSGVTVHTKEGCNSWAERWAAQVANFAPDVVVIVSGSWEPCLAAPEWSRFRTIGDQVYDDWLDRLSTTPLSTCSPPGRRTRCGSTPRPPQQRSRGRHVRPQRRRS